MYGDSYKQQQGWFEDLRTSTDYATIHRSLSELWALDHLIDTGILRELRPVLMGLEDRIQTLKNPIEESLYSKQVASWINQLISSSDLAGENQGKPSEQRVIAKDIDD